MEFGLGDSPAQGKKLHFLHVCGYHSTSTYKWMMDGKEIEGEHHPVIYVAKCGSFSCCVTNSSMERTDTFSFKVEGECYIVLLYCCIMYTHCRIRG